MVLRRTRIGVGLFAVFLFVGIHRYVAAPPKAPEQPEHGPLNPEIPVEYEWMRNISIVYTWANGTDPVYQAARKHHGGPKQIGTPRDRDNNELLYSMRSLVRFLPWHTGMIYLVTPGDKPTWMNASHPRIKLINQDTLMPPEDVPSFNSNAIEQYLYLIPGLTEQFLHFNDDYFLYSYVPPNFFFTPTKAPRFFFEGGRPMHGTAEYLKMKEARSKKVWLGSVYRSCGLVEDTYGSDAYDWKPVRYLSHAPFAYLRSAFIHMHERWKEAFALTSRTKFRNIHDVLTPFAHHGFMIHEGQKTLGIEPELVTRLEMQQSIKYMKISPNVEANQKFFDYIEARPRLKLYTINDAFGRHMVYGPGNVQLAEWFTKNYGAWPSPFEIAPIAEGTARNQAVGRKRLS